MSIRFAHIRIIAPDGHIDSKGGLTIAYEQQGNTINYAIARCHERDNFVKSQGRVKAAGRLLSDKHRQSTTLDITSFKEKIYKMPLNYVGNV